MHKIITPYGYDVVLLGDRGFRSVDLFKFIDETLKWKYCIRCTKDIGIAIKDNPKIKKLEVKNKKLLDNLLDGTIDKSTYTEKKSELDADLKELYEQRQVLQNSVFLYT